MASEFSQQDKNDLKLNWIKAGLVLSHIKTALHSFIENVSLKHTHPVQKIYLGPTMTQPKYRQQKVKNDPKLSSKSNFNVISFERSNDDEDTLCTCVFHDAVPSLVDKSVIMAETLKHEFDFLNDSNDRRCVDCYNKRRIEFANSLHRGKHIFIAHQYQKTYKCEQSSPCQHHAITITCLISNDKEAICNTVIKGKEIQIMNENSILDLIYNRICEYFYSNSFNIIDSSVKNYVECSFVKWYGLIINNCEHFASRCLVGKDDKFQDQSLIDNLKNTLSNVIREDSQASISSPCKYFIQRKSVEWNFFKRSCNLLTQRFINEECTKLDLWESWIGSEQDYSLQCLARVLSEHKSMRHSVANIVPPHRKISSKSHVGADVLEDLDTKVFYCYYTHRKISSKSHVGADVLDDQDTKVFYCCYTHRKISSKSHVGADVLKDLDTKVFFCCYPQQDFGQALSPTSFQQEESSSVLVMCMNALAMIELLQENSDKLKGGRNLPMTMWDFTGQYAFYKTHWMILKRHAIYLLVSDASEQVAGHVADSCYFNSGEIMNCKVNAKILEGDECRFEVEELNDTDEIYLRFYAKEVQSRQILQSCIIAIISCAESLPSQSAERGLYLVYPYMENGDLPRNINLENSAKNMCTNQQEHNFQTWTQCNFQIACAVGYLYNSSVRAPVFHQAATSNSVFLAECFGMKIGNFGIAVEAIQNTNVANWTIIQRMNDYNLCNMNLVQYNAYDIFSVGFYSACYLQTIRGNEWLRLAIDGTENTPWLSTLVPKCSKQSISFIVKKLYQTWLDWNVCMGNKTDERKKIRETYLHHIFEMCSALLSSNRSGDQDELSNTLQITEDIKNHACNYKMESLSEDLASVVGFSDCVRCFHCGVGLRHWMSEDDPWIEHTRWSASCFYVYKMKGEEFVSLVKMAVEIAEREEAKINNIGANQPPTNNTETSTADTAKKDSENNRVNDSTVSKESTGATCGSAGGDAASNPSPSDADIQKYLLTDAAQSVLDMGYQPKLVQQAVQRILMKNGPVEMTGQSILEAIFEIEEDGSSKSKSKPSSQPAQENERNETVYGAAEGASSEEVQIDSEQIRREHRELRETTLCKICLDNTISVVFLPCGHLVTCSDCAPAMRKCPICRTLIKGTVKIFFG
ncbi:hypothetical protein CHS0354_015450 [Potamilus streckersoni]|uniref:RING-type domain-containing protein n=1 Tax=Potamilus streckersoni TaxID=2493646 RepID=A0AAE0VY63_9BIVA|nr:hypothetical protein CHS0354_015450 [Potamilus streckersoni]